MKYSTEDTTMKPEQWIEGARDYTPWYIDTERGLAPIYTPIFYVPII